jgi:hypothetical protein
MNAKSSILYKLLDSGIIFFVSMIQEMFPPPALAWSPGVSPQADQLPRQRTGTKRKRNSKDDSSPRQSPPVDGE